MKDLNTPFKVFAGCKIVTGYRRSIIYDLNRYDYHFIPNDLAEILLNFECKTIHEIQSLFDDSDADTIDSYFDFLMKYELIFFVSKELITSFAEITHDWFYPGYLSNVIIEDNGSHQYDIIMKNLLEVQCRNIQIRFNTTKSFVIFVDFLKGVEDSLLNSIEIFLPYASSMNKEYMNLYFRDLPLITKYHIYNSPFEDLYYSGSSISVAIYTQYFIEDIKFSSKVSLETFLPEVSLFVEAKNHNPYYNKKLCIDEHGNIKTNLNSLTDFGNIYKGLTLKYVFENISEAKIYWDISRDKTTKCKECEFRYMCVYDGEPIYNIENDEYILISDCGYDPINTKFNN